MKGNIKEFLLGILWVGVPLYFLLLTAQYFINY